jgi:hypothetical protein
MSAAKTNWLCLSCGHSIPKNETATEGSTDTASAAPVATPSITNSPVEPALATPPTPLPVLPQSSSQRLSKKKPFRAVGFVFIVVIVVAGVLYYLFMYHRLNKTTTALSSVSTDVRVITVTIPTDLNEASRQPAYSSSASAYIPLADSETKGQAYIGTIHPGSSFPSTPNIIDDTAAIGSGHYAYTDPIGATQLNPDSGVFVGGKLIVDGKVVYQGSDLMDYSQVISNNGLHYAYVRIDHNKPSIYVDGKLSSLKYDLFLPLLGISNDGSDVVYDTNDNNSNDVVYRNNTKVGTIYDLSGLAFSSDLSHSIIAGLFPEVSGPNDPFSDLLIDGKSAKTTDSNSLPGDQLGMSQNGLHTVYTVSNTSNTNNDLYLDNKKVGQPSSPVDVQVDDNGDYSYIDTSASELFVNTKSYTLSSTSVNTVNAGNLISSINSNGSHYFVANPIKKYFDLDGKPVALSGDIFKAEFAGNTLYVYKFSK